MRLIRSGMVFTGADDKMIPADQVSQFAQEMSAAKANYSIKSYQGVKHSFTNPQADEFGQKFNMPLAYSPEADEDSWNLLQIGLKNSFKW